MSTKSAIDCGFGTAKLGDVLPLKGPLFGQEVLARLTRILNLEEASKQGSDAVHYYDLFLFGVYIGMAKASLRNGETKWENL